MLTSVKLEFDMELPDSAEEIIEQKVITALKKIDLTKAFQEAFEKEIEFMVEDGTEIQEMLIPIAKEAIRKLVKVDDGN